MPPVWDARSMPWNAKFPHTHHHAPQQRFAIRKATDVTRHCSLGGDSPSTPSVSVKMETDAPQRKLATCVHIQALDAIVNVNSLFTLAVFVGLAWNPYDPSNTLISDQSCIPTKSTAESLVSFHVYSFASFLFSSLLALTLKQAIRLYSRPLPSFTIYNHTFPHFSIKPYVNKNLLRAVLLLTALGSVCGCLFLMLALVNVVQIKLGTLSCGSLHSYGAVVPLVIFVPAGLLIYIGLVFYAITR